MKISDRSVREDWDTTEVSAIVDGFRLWYRVPRSYAVTDSADPFVAAALLPAMRLGQKIEIDPGLTVSPQLLDNLQTLQEIHHTWNSIFKIVPIEARTSPSRSLHAGAMSFFSGGVDSLYTFLKRQGELTHLVFIQGFDFFAESGNSGALTAADLTDLSQLAFKLLTPGNAVTAFLKSRLSQKTLSNLSDYRRSGVVPKGLEEALAGDLNRVLAGGSIWQDRRFAGITLRPDTQALLKAGPQTEDTIQLNRRLIEDAFPLEISRRRGRSFETAVDRNTGFVEGAGKTLIPVATNYFSFGYRYNLSRTLTQGNSLACIALILGFPLVYVPAAYSYSQLIPLGSHPLTDPLWSNGSVRIVHDGAEVRRVDKVVKIARNGDALANLRVCFTDMNVNCGRCSKCLRTMIPLALLDVPSAPFPPLPPPGSLSRMRLANENELRYFRENFDPALGTAHPELKRALRTVLRRYERRRLIDEIDAQLFGGSVKKAYRWMVRPGERHVRIDTTPPGRRPL
jgi:hypothetical protein